MKHCLLVSLSLFVFVSGLNAQFFEDAGPLDSFVIRFTTDTIPQYLPDTAATPLWQIGRTHKVFFTTDTAGVSGIMTDTTSSYPINANNWFVLKIRRRSHPLISFWHKYQTADARDGGVVEYSLNKGLTWHNVKDSCNIDPWGSGGGIITSDFYGSNDTLPGGEPAFSGINATVRRSQFQFAGYPGAKSTAVSPCNFYSIDTIFIRFRFISDTIPDTFAGWFIDSVKVNYYKQSMSVKHANGASLMPISPNPSRTGIFIFPYLDNKDEFLIDVFNTLGQRILQTAYCRSLDLSHFPYGLYFFKVTNGTEYYSGRLLYE